MDGDSTYDAGEIERFLDLANTYDQVIGTRSQKNISRVHRFGNRVISSIFNMLFGTSITDVCSGMYLLNSQLARGLEFRRKGFSVEAEIIAQTALQGHVGEVPINYRKRLGQTKLSAIVSGIDILKSIFNLARIYNPIILFSIIAATAAIPGFAIILWVLRSWLLTGVFHSGWTLAGMMLLLLAAQACIVGTISRLMKRSEIRLEKLIRKESDTARC